MSHEGPRIAIVLGALLLACSRPAAERAEGKDGAPHEKPASSAEHKDEPEHEELPKRVRVSAEVIAASKIATRPAAREILRATLELPGELVGDPDKTARVASPVPGRLEKVSFAEGASVKARDVLALVRVPDLADRSAAVASSAARSQAARANASRLEALAAKGLAAAQEVADAKAQATGLEAEARAAGERVRTLDVGAASGGSLLALRAPIAGTIVARSAVVGQAVDPEHPIATIVELDELWFLGRVFESDLSRVRLGASAEVELNAYPSERFDGAVALVGSQIDPVARTVTARVPLKNRDALLRIGLFGTARIAIGDPADAKPTLVVSRSAVTEINGKTVVFVRHPDDDFELHEIVLGRAALGKVEVHSGLRDGEAVVTEGVFTLKSLVLKSTLGGDD